MNGSVGGGGSGVKGIDPPLQGQEILRINNLRVSLHSRKGVAKAVDGVSLEVKKGEILGVVGESSSGKSAMAYSILGLLPHLGEEHPEEGPVRGEIVEGEIWFQGRNLLGLSEEELMKIRGKEISIIFQKPIPSLAPIEYPSPRKGSWEALGRDVGTLIREALGSLEIPEAYERYFYHSLHFGEDMEQRRRIAVALLSNPSLLIADEPTFQMRVTVQRRVLELFKELKVKMSLTTLLLTQSLGIAAELCDNVAVMYCGKIVEVGDVYAVFKKTRHPYTKGLLASIPRLMERERRLGEIPGEPPDPYNPPSGCRFHPRCAYAVEICKVEDPDPVEVEEGHLVKCHRAYEIT